MTVAFTNFASTRTTSILLSGGTAVSVTPGSGANFPATAGGAWFYLVLTDSLTAPTVREVIKVTNRATDSMATLVRAQDGTSALEWPSGSYCELRLTKGALEDIVTASLQAADNLSALTDQVAARANLQLGSIATQNSDNVYISGGLISLCGILGGTLNATPIGSVVPEAGTFTTLRATTSINYRGADNASATNTGYGEGALDSNNGGVANTAIGNDALTTITNGGNNNTAVGRRAMLVADTASNNVAVGMDSLKALADGVNNIAIGLEALLSAVNSNRNIAVGDQALKLTTGDDNIGIGDAAGDTITTGIRNICIGRNADTIAAALNSIAIGWGALATADNQVVLGNSSVTETILRGQVKGGAGTGTGQPVMVGTLSVNTTAVGNVGAGTDDLMTYALPANSLSANNKGVRITMWGIGANNLNSKTLGFAFGSYTATASLSVGQAVSWKITAVLLRNGANAQTLILTWEGDGIAGTAVVAALTQTDTAAITIKGTGLATTNNDIVQNALLVEFIN